MKILNSKEKKKLLQRLRDQFGFTGELPFEFLMNERRQRISIVSRGAAEFPYEQLRVDSMGNYFCALHPDGVRLSIEGSQIIGPLATKNVVMLDDACWELWRRGEQVPTSETHEGFVLVGHRHPASREADYFGCGKIVEKNGERVILNYVSKTRRVSS